MTPQLKKALRARAHTLKPVVITGAAGVSDAVLAEIDNALNHHELIKVRLRDDDREERQRQAEYVCEKLDAEWVQTLGQIVTLYRKKPAAAAEAKPARRPAAAARKGNSAKRRVAARR